MTTQVRITRLKEITLDTTTLNLTDTDPSDDLVYEGPARIRTLMSRVTIRDVEGQVLAAQELTMSLPVATSGSIKAGDSVIVTASPEDPALIGRRYRIRGLFSQSQATAHRFPIEELDG